MACIAILLIRTECRLFRGFNTISGGNMGDLEFKKPNTHAEQVRINEVLFEAIRCSDVDTVEKMLRDCGVDPKATVEIDRNLTVPPLEYAVFVARSRMDRPIEIRNDLKVIELLLNAPGIDVNTKNSKGGTPLIRAIANEDIHAVRTLLTKPGIDLDYIDPISGGNARDHALTSSKDFYIKPTRIADLLAEYEGKSVKDQSWGEKEKSRKFRWGQYLGNRYAGMIMD